MSLLLGLDQGGSKTWAAVSDAAGRLLGVGRAAGGYPMRRTDEAMAHICRAVDAALAAANLEGQPVDLLYAGLTSADWPDEYDFLQRRVEALGLARQVRVVNDTIIALRGGTSHPYGAIVTAGTGSNCAIRSPAGEEYLYHYYVENDLQGGVGLGRRMLRAIYRAETGREPTTHLTRAVLHQLNFASVDELLRADCERRFGDEAVKTLAPLVFQAAHTGDEVAASLLTAFGQGLAELVTAGLRRFEMTNLPVEVVLSGSVFKGEGGLLQAVMRDEIEQVAPRARLIDARYEPVVGAVLLALEAAEVAADGEVAANIERGSQRYGLIRQGDGEPTSSPQSVPTG